MTGTEVAILRTILYADIFSFPLTKQELYRYLITDHPISQKFLIDTLDASVMLAQHVHHEADYMCLQAREAIIAQRVQREQMSQAMWRKAERYGRWLGKIPFVRMVALTGALAMRNPASEQDDYDYFIVTVPGRVWLARGLAVLLVRLVRLLGDELCPNYVVASDKLVQTQQDLYMAHEVTQMHVLHGVALYHAMLDVNAWSRQFLPHAYALDTPPDTPQPVQHLLERLLGGRLGEQLEQWEYRRKTRKFSQQSKLPYSSAEIDRQTVKGHFEDHGHPVMVAYRERLAAYGLQEIFHAQAGD